VDKYNRSDWLEITRLDTLRPKKDWQKEFNVQLPDERISFGFFHDVEYKGEGVLVDRVIPGTLAEDLGLQKGDVIIGMDEGELANIDDLAAAKSEKKRGDPVSLSVFRNKETILLKGQFPEVVYYDAFFYKPASGAVQARYYANIFELETSRVGAVKLYISPEMVNVDIPVRVIINGEEVFNDMVEYDKQF
jgi:C-terminal processing protease CtpA/Prc